MCLANSAPEACSSTQADCLPSICRPELWHPDVDKIVPIPPVPAKTLTSYVGEYRYQDDRIKITYEKGRLATTGPRGRCELRPFKPTKFYCVGADLEFNFQIDKSGRVTGVVAEYPDHYTDEFTRVK